MMITMTKEQCFRTFQGDHGKRKQPDYCIEGIRYDSKTNVKLDIPRCQYWLGDWNGGCIDLIPRKQRRLSGPKRGVLA